ncbi:MAG: hypothetical protein U0S48_23610 [Solirubrobacteraceae bacterium]
MATSFSSLLRGGDPRSLGRVNEAVQAVLRDTPRCGELLACLFLDDQTVRMRAGDALEKVARRRPDLVEPYLPDLLDRVAEIEQPSVQWHLAEIFGEVSLSPAQRRQAIEILKRNLETCEDWIVITDSMQTLTGFAATDPELRDWLLPVLRNHRGAGRKAIAKRAEKLLARLGE